MDTIQILLIAWGVVTAALVCVWIYRGTLENREEDQIFLNASGESMAREQRAVVSRIERLAKPLVTLAILSGLLLIAMGALWAWQSYQRF
jgi:hypothetical protein